MWLVASERAHGRYWPLRSPLIVELTKFAALIGMQPICNGVVAVHDEGAMFDQGFIERLA